MYNTIDVVGIDLNKKKICHRHFAEDAYKSYGKKKVLKDKALPTLNLPGIPSAEIVKSIDLEEEQYTESNIVVLNLTACNDFGLNVIGN